MKNPFYITGIIPAPYFCDREEETSWMVRTNPTALPAGNEDIQIFILPGEKAYSVTGQEVRRGKNTNQVARGSHLVCVKGDSWVLRVPRGRTGGLFWRWVGCAGR